MKAHCCLGCLEWSFNQPEPQAPPLHKLFVPQLKAPRFWEKNGSSSWLCKPLTCMPSYAHLGNLYIG